MRAHVFFRHHTDTSSSHHAAVLSLSLSLSLSPGLVVAGLLGLHNLLYLTQNYTEQTRAMLQKEHSSGFPLALAAINISAFLTQLLQKNAGLIGTNSYRRIILKTAPYEIARCTMLFLRAILLLRHFVHAGNRDQRLYAVC